MPEGLILWLFLHGAAVWQTSVAALVIAASALALRRVRRAAARDAAARRARLTAPEEGEAALRQGEVTIAGRIEAAGGSGRGVVVKAVVYLARVRGSAPSWDTIAEARVGPLVLVTGGERVAIEGPVEIVVGSRQARLTGVEEVLAKPPGGLPAWPPGLALHQCSLAAGDEVWARGVLEREGGGRGGTYRDRPIPWRLGPTHAAPAVVLAFAGVPRLRAASVLGAAAIHLAAAAIVFVAVFGIGGRIAMRRVAELSPEDFSLPIATAPTLRAAAIAAVSPFHRSDAIAWAAGPLEARRDERSLGVAAALREADGDCERAAALWLDHGQLEREDAAEHARALRVLAPSIRSGRDELLQRIRSDRRAITWRCEPIDQLVVWSDLARAAEALGDPALAAELSGRADRFRRALAQRDIGVLLAVLEWL